MSLWASDDYLFPNYIMYLFPLYFYIMKMGDIRGVYADAAGLFWEDRWRSIIEAVANILLNYILVRLFGAFGIMIATIITLFFIGFLGSTHVIFKHYFNKGKRKYLLVQTKLLVTTIIIGITSYLVCASIMFKDNLTNFVLRLVICFTITPLLYWIRMHKTDEWRTMKSMISTFIHK